MAATVIYGVDFKRDKPNPANPTPLETKAPPMNFPYGIPAFVDTAPAEMSFPFVAPDGDCG